MCLNSSLSFFISRPPKMAIYFSSHSSVCSACVYVQHKDVTQLNLREDFPFKKTSPFKKNLHASSVCMNVSPSHMGIHISDTWYIYFLLSIVLEIIINITMQLSFKFSSKDIQHYIYVDNDNWISSLYYILYVIEFESINDKPNNL